MSICYHCIIHISTNSWVLWLAPDGF